MPVFLAGSVSIFELAGVVFYPLKSCVTPHPHKTAGQPFYLGLSVRRGLLHSDARGSRSRPVSRSCEADGVDFNDCVIDVRE